MEVVLEDTGTNIIKYLTDEDLSEVSKVNKKFNEICESVLLWRCLLSSFNPRSNKESLKTVRVRNQKPRPQVKPSEKKPIFETNSGVSKQWVFIPPDLERQIKVITINKAAQLRKNEEFKSRCFQLLETWSDSISRTLSILEANETRGDTSNPYSYIITWRDKLKVLEDILNELNDVCVAKVDAVFTGFKPHKVFISQIERTKRCHRESKEIWEKLGKIESNLKEMNNLDGIKGNIRTVLEYLEGLNNEKGWNDRTQKAFSGIVEKFLVSVESEANMNKVFKNNDVKVLEKIKSVGGILAGSKFMKGDDRIRPSTSYVQSKSENESLIQVLHIVNVAGELRYMVDKLCNNDIPSEVVKIYTEIPVEFNIWKHENQVFWARLVHAFYERLLRKEKVEIKIESDEEEPEGSGSFVVANWTIN